jgi:CYTH domain-containing protein
VTRRVQQRTDELFETLERKWLADGGKTLAKAVKDLGRALDRASTAGVEVERKYLLRALPELPEGAREIEIEQGWLPGTTLRERLRRSVERDCRRYLRTVKFGKGLQRTEVEEETTPEVFEALWALTEGCRVKKRRYAVPDGDVVWEVDEFLDRDLVLAEVELRDPAEQVVLPSWLADHVVREVTGDGDYVNLNLAK